MGVSRLVRLYLVEEVAKPYGVRFYHLEVGSPTAKGVRVKGSFNTSSRKEAVNFSGPCSL